MVTTRGGALAYALGAFECDRAQVREQLVEGVVESGHAMPHLSRWAVRVHDVVRPEWEYAVGQGAVEPVP